jgi:hypothetical protein
MIEEYTSHLLDKSFLNVGVWVFGQESIRFGGVTFGEFSVRFLKSADTDLSLLIGFVVQR